MVQPDLPGTPGTGAIGGCRWGDYSMGAVANGRVFMSTGFVAQGFRDNLANWGTFIWSAPPP